MLSSVLLQVWFFRHSIWMYKQWGMVERFLMSILKVSIISEKRKLYYWQNRSLWIFYLIGILTVFWIFCCAWTCAAFLRKLFHMLLSVTWFVNSNSDSWIHNVNKKCTERKNLYSSSTPCKSMQVVGREQKVVYTTLK